MPAPKGNQYGLGNEGGRPPKFESVEDLQDSIDSYFSGCICDRKPLTITGLAYHLGFESRQSFYDYEKNEVFSYSIKRARLRIEMAYEVNLHGNTNAGSIFALKNFGWSDKQEIDQKTTLKDARIDESKLTDEELRVLVEIQRKSGIS